MDDIRTWRIGKKADNMNGPSRRISKKAHEFLLDSLAASGNVVYFRAMLTTPPGPPVVTRNRWGLAPNTSDNSCFVCLNVFGVRRSFRHYVADCGSPAALGASPFSACHQKFRFRCLGTIRHHSAPWKPVSARVVSTHPAFSLVFAFVFFSFFL